MARRKSTNRKGTSLFDENAAPDANVQFVPISEETRRRYLNYALSVITSRALPDVRDGLKPVQRRILYVMFDRLRLTADGKTRKCAKICGDTTGSFHPHGDIAVYEALVRLAQDFTLRYPLVIGQGNFGSVMGLRAAAARYTEAKLSRLAENLMSELRFQTVEMRPTYDAADEEPVVVPARYPALLVNGASGIAVGMATNMPPHNLGEVIKACIHLIENPDASTAQLTRYVKGPDFPLGGRIVTDRAELKEMYETGRGSVKVRGEWRFDQQGKKQDTSRIIVYSVPYGVTTGPLMAEIGELIAARKLPQLEGVNDETNEENGLRIAIDLKSGADPEAVIAYLFKHTALEQNFGYNATCLVPSDHGSTVPRVLSLQSLLQHFLDFRYETVRRRLEYQLAQLRKRIHILEGFAIVFDGLDRALKIIRASDGKKDAAKRLMAEFPLDEIQTDAVLELQLYRISMLEIGDIREELARKKAEAAAIEALLTSKTKMWKLISTELEQIATDYGDARRSELGSTEEIVEYDPQAYIVRENTNVVVTKEGWIKRVGQLSNVSKTRVREGDSVLTVVPGSTLDHAVFFCNDGIAYTLPIDQLPVSSGYGEPLAKRAKMKDGVSVVAALPTDTRFVASLDEVGDGVGLTLFIATKGGQVMRLPFEAFRTPSTKAGRKFCRLGKTDQIVYIDLVREAETVFIASKKARILHFAIEDVPVLGGAGKGVRGIKLEAGDEVLGVVQMSRPSDAMRVKNDNDNILSFGQTKYQVTSRGGRGVKTSSRTGFVELIQPDIQLVDWSELGGVGEV
ncbi:MAG TPA: DNA topoisomerase 4 subunit A [Planctomycetaceae bacterium]|nr:DNA topoisomerase 4 subunit A [Planctomycetaceae bacterium]